MNYSVFVSCPKGLEYVLEEELKSLGLGVTKVNPQGVYGVANLTILYQICLWTRIANRVQVILFSGSAPNEQTILKLCSEFHWQTVFTHDKSIAIEFHGSSERIRNTMYGAQVVKDGIVDHFRHLTGERPSVDKEKPQIRIHAYLKNDEITVSFDVCGYSLHQRGYRTQAGLAPIKENVAAALLVRAKWPELAAKGYALQDMFCGSGTLVIEAAMMAAHIAPGLIRQDQSMQFWAQHQPSLWERIRKQALEQVKPLTVKLLGTDADKNAIIAAQANAERAGVAPLVEFTHRALAECTPNHAKGLVVGNPPYGERLEEPSKLMPTYKLLGSVLHAHYQGWQAAIITSNPLLAKAISLRSNKQYTLYNGAIECKLYCFELEASNELKSGTPSGLTGNAQMFLNRLQKNYKHLQKWAANNNIECYRVYDADLPEYAYAIDLYRDYVVLQEYAAPASIPAAVAEKRSLEVLQVVPQALDIEADRIVVKQRKKQKGTAQYEKLNKTHHGLIVREGKARFKVNLYDYLDTGVFLDHRLLRLRMGHLPIGARLLNLYCYTATASIHAAIAGANTTNVDLSNTYLQWAQENFRLNELDVRKHQFIQEDCLEWMKNARGGYDVIYLDPPSFSNSKRMKDVLDIQRDHVDLIKAAARLLDSEGIIYFSTNLRSFKLDPSLMEEYKVHDISAQTIDQDFKRNEKIHHCFEIKLA